MDILIAGVGPIGGILAVHSAMRGERVVLLDPYREHMEAIRKKGLKVTGLKGLHIEFPTTCTSYGEISGKTFDAIFIATKATLLASVLEELRENWVIGNEERTFLVSFQNGLDTEEILAGAVGRERSLRAVLNYAGSLVAPGIVEMTFFNPPNYIGPVIQGGEGEAMARRIASLLTNGGLETEFSPNIRLEVWKKVIRNAIMAPISTLTGGNIREMLDLPGTRRLMEDLLKEGIDVAEGLGYELGEGFYDSCVSYLEDAGTHIPSMLTDVREGRETEIGFLNRKIVEYGERLGIPTHANHVVSSLIMAIDEMNKRGR